MSRYAFLGLVAPWVFGLSALGDEGLELGDAVDAYLNEVEDAVAATRLAELLRRDDATATRLLAAVMRAPDVAGAQSIQVAVPHRGERLVAEVRVPDGHSAAEDRLPVVLDISGGFNLHALALHDAVLVAAEEFRPPEFSDEGRDGFVKLLRVAAHRAHGDPDRLWVVGYSWAAHAAIDTAMHRPHTVRGVVTMAGGPRRVHFRLLANLAGADVLAFCGAKDDPELLWNLRELERALAPIDAQYTLTIDPDAGHSGPLEGLDVVAERIVSAPSLAVPTGRRGRLLADGPGVESPLLRFDDVDDARVRVPDAVPVSSSLGHDAKRRATIAAMRDNVASIDYEVEQNARGSNVTLRAHGVRRCTLFLRWPEFAPGRSVTVRAGDRVVTRGPLEMDRAALLEEARRTGERIRPALSRVAVSF